MRRVERNKLKRRRLLFKVGRFYVLAFAISWAGWLPALLRQWGVPGFGSILWLGPTAFGALGPAIAAWILDRKILLVFCRETSWRWLLAAAFIPIFLLVATNGLSSCILGARSQGTERGWPILWLATMAVGANVWEEVGWRAYALRRLEDVMPSWVAALIVGVVWAGWHLPLFVSGWSGMTHIPIGWWAARIVGTSVIMAWLYNRTGGSLWGVTVFHIESNVWAAWTGVSSHWMEAAVVWMAAGILLALTAGKLGKQTGADTHDNVRMLCKSREVAFSKVIAVSRLVVR